MVPTRDVWWITVRTDREYAEAREKKRLLEPHAAVYIFDERGKKSPTGDGCGHPLGSMGRTQGEETKA